MSAWLSFCIMSEFVCIMTCVNTVKDFTSSKMSEFVSMMTCVDTDEVLLVTKCQNLSV